MRPEAPADIIIEAGLTGPTMRSILLAFQSTAVLGSLPLAADHREQVRSDLRHLWGWGPAVYDRYLENAAQVVSANPALAARIRAHLRGGS